MKHRQGKVIWFDERDQEGIIKDAAGREFYFNYSVLNQKHESLHIEGRPVFFSYNKDIPWTNCAKDIVFDPYVRRLK